MKPSLQIDRARSRNWLSLRFLIPALLLATLIADVTLRSVPPGIGYFRAWEPATLFATAEGSFAPNFHYENSRAFGDLSSFGNLPRFRQYHREVFTTDEFGFRNPPSGGTHDTPAAIVVGDSFAAGCGISDDDTLSAQLTSRLLDKRVYNGGSSRPTWKITNELLQRLHMRGGLVIWEVSEREPLPKSVSAEATHFFGAIPITAPPSSEAYRILRGLTQWTESRLTYSPLRVFLGRGFRKIENGAWLPNPPEQHVVIGRLRNGDSMLFLDSEVHNFHGMRDDGGGYLREINDLVRGSGNEFLALLVPDKYAVYFPLLDENGQLPVEGESHLDRLEKDLRRLGVPVLNLTSALRSQAVAGLQSREYNYIIDDTHWSRLGIQTAATEILREWNNRPTSASNASIGRGSEGTGSTPEKWVAGN